LKLHPESGRDVQDLIGREDSSAAQAADAKFEYRRANIRRLFACVKYIFTHKCTYKITLNDCNVETYAF